MSFFLFFGHLTLDAVMILFSGHLLWNTPFFQFFSGNSSPTKWYMVEDHIRETVGFAWPRCLEKVDPKNIRTQNGGGFSW